MASCQASYGEKFTKGNLEIYFTADCESFVKPLGVYFEENNLIFDHPHSMQLTSSDMGSEDPGFILKMVQTDSKKPLPQNKQDHLTSLELELEQEVFFGANLKIVVCDENFIEINK